MELRFCDECGSRIADDEIAGGRALIQGDFAYCPRCARKQAPAASSPPPAPERSEEPKAPAPKAFSPSSSSKLPRPATPGKGQAGSFRPPTPQQGTVKLPAPGRKFQPLSRNPAGKSGGKPFASPAPARSPSTAKLPAPRSGSSGSKPLGGPVRFLGRASSSAQIKLPANLRGRRSKGKAELPDAVPGWGGVAVRAFALFVGGLLLGYLGLMLLTRQGLTPRFGSNVQQPAPGEAPGAPETTKVPDLPAAPAAPEVPATPGTPEVPADPAVPVPVPGPGPETEPAAGQLPPSDGDTPVPTEGRGPDVPADPAEGAVPAAPAAPAAPEVPEKAPEKAPAPSQP